MSAMGDDGLVKERYRERLLICLARSGEMGFLSSSRCVCQRFGYKPNADSCMANFLLRRNQRLSPHHPDHELFRCACFSRSASAIPIHHFVALAFDLRHGAISCSDEVEASVHTTSASRPRTLSFPRFSRAAFAIPMRHFANI